MADDDVSVDAPESGGKSKKSFPLMVVGILMLVEGVGVFFAVKHFMPDPSSAMAADAEAMEEGADMDVALAEVALAECRPVNKTTGKLISIQIRVSALVAAEELEKAEKAIEANRARIEERINVVLRSVEPQFLNEPGLQTIKRRLKSELDGLFGEEEKLFREVLVPELILSGSGV